MVFKATLTIAKSCFCALVTMLAFHGAAHAQATAQVKLVIISGPDGRGVAVVDYPNLGRCERAAAFVEAEWRRRFEESKAAPREPNTFLLGPAFTTFAFCIPG